MTPRSMLRTTSIIEAITWALLITAMLLKYVIAPEVGNFAVPYAGAAHGTVFLAYLFTGIVVATHGRWSWKPVVLGGLASIPPFATLAFDAWAERKGLVKDSWDAVPTTGGKVPFPFLKHFGRLVTWTRQHPITLAVFAIAAFCVILTPSLGAALRG